MLQEYQSNDQTNDWVQSYQKAQGPCEQEWCLCLVLFWSHSINNNMVQPTSRLNYVLSKTLRNQVTGKCIKFQYHWAQTVLPVLQNASLALRPQMLSIFKLTNATFIRAGLPKRHLFIFELGLVIFQVPGSKFHESVNCLVLSVHAWP